MVGRGDRQREEERAGKIEEMKKKDCHWRRSSKSPGRKTIWSFHFSADTWAALSFLQVNSTFETKDREGGFTYKHTLLMSSLLFNKRHCVCNLIYFGTLDICVSFYFEFASTCCLGENVASTTQGHLLLHGESFWYLQPGCVIFIAGSGGSRSCKTQHPVG